MVLERDKIQEEELEISIVFVSITSHKYTRVFFIEVLITQLNNTHFLVIRVCCQTLSLSHFTDININKKTINNKGIYKFEISTNRIILLVVINGINIKFGWKYLSCILLRICCQ